MLPYIFLYTACQTSEEPSIIDLRLYNGAIIMDSSNQDDRIQNTVYIDKGVVVEPPEGNVTFRREIDLNGRVVMPSFHDAHTHLLAGSFVSDKLLLVGTSTMSAIEAKLGDYVETEPDLPWIVGYGWIKSAVDNPIGVALDPVSGDYPVALFDSAGHSLLVNTKAMELAGITATTAPPPGGIIHTDEQGNPTGFLQESAIELVSPLMVSQFSDEQLSANLEAQIKLFHKAGITSVSEILAVPGVNLSFPELYHRLEDLNFRVAYHIPIFTIDDLQLMEQYVGDTSEWIHCQGAKVWVDGSSGSGESWSLSPSDIDENHYGSQYFEVEDLITIIEHAETFGYSIKFHVNGDAAVRATLDALEAVQSEIGTLTGQYLFEHTVLIDPADYDRIYNLGVTISIQPPHALVGIYGDQADHWREERIDRAWDFPALEAANLPIVLGTDWPVWPTIDGFTNWSTAVNGLNVRNLSEDTVLKGYGDLGRETAGLHHVGLKVGQEADFIIVTSNPMEDEVPTVLETWVKGQRVY